MKRILLTFFMLVLLPALVFAGDYVIGEGDGLDISVWGSKELNVSVKVRPDGKITMPGLGDILASGNTPNDLQKALGKNLKDLVKNPIVTVTVREITNSKVYLFGSGVHSGVYDLTRRTTLLQLLCTASGGSGGVGTVTASAPVSSGNAKVADYRHSYVLRNGKRIKEDFHKLFVGGDTSEDITLESNDAIFIPLLADRNVYVLGAVNAPKSIEYRESMTVMDAILESGGFSKFAKQNDTAILRKEGEKDVSIPVRAKDLINDGDLSQNTRLRPGDYIIVKEGIF
jgi:polysaccharide export outer membrane protein